MAVDSEQAAGTFGEARLQRFLAEARMGVWELDLPTGRLTWSPEVFVLLGGEPSEFDGTAAGFFARVHPEDHARLNEAMADAMRDGRDYYVEYRVALPDERERWLACRGSLAYDANGSVQRVGGLVWDVTEQRRMQAHLRLTERMATVGTLTASVAHEINNPLASWNISLAAIEQALKTSPPDEAALLGARELIAGMRQSTDRVCQIVRDLRTFSRPDEEAHLAVEVHPVLESALTLVEAELRPRARLVRGLQRVPRVQANEARLGQVFLNLLVNAVQAIPPGAPEGNEVRVRTSSSEAGEVLIEIEDTGSGIAPDRLSAIFEPFFTTKPVGMGSGLGLPICHNIVSRLGGRIDVRSKLGAGSTFSVILPRAGAEPPLEPATRPPGATRVRYTLLVVDDEASLAKGLAVALTPHRVLVANSGREGLALLESEDVDCILCDVIMPEMDGPAFHEALRRLNRGLERRVIFVTGGAFTPRSREFLARVEQPVLEKPFDLATLHDLISKVVDPGFTRRAL